ncbi:zinc finger BED domain-containing protein RICESLEEPER 2-like [Arachis duranensis]|uniref:Zinc finger BED domain-containing protein RICESLEEPER 2-like n=1 Tax=Arachis duranensis TaxID=130453 RepID=A0A9C6T505_ARADU|nr:zinc finger BED domain-containing protein RICESLEEPER 2-like [Arachis duranensis]
MDSLSSTPIENNNETEPSQDDEGQAIEAHVQGTQEEGQEETQEGGQEVSQSVQNSSNKKGLTSEDWKHFRREQIDGKWKAICKYCERKIGGDQGTKHLHDHIRICPIRTIRGPKQSILKTVFVYVPAPHTAEVLSDVLVNSLYDWNIDRKLSTLTVDNCSTNNAMIHLVLDKISPSNFVKRGEFFHMRYCAHIVNLIVKDGMNAIYGSIEKIRDSVSFWVATPKREEKFEETCMQLNINYRRKLALDCRTRWNSTYLMLTSALPYREVFERLRHRESLYKVVPSDDE